MDYDQSYTKLIMEAMLKSDSTHGKKIDFKSKEEKKYIEQGYTTNKTISDAYKKLYLEDLSNQPVEQKKEEEQKPQPQNGSTNTDTSTEPKPEENTNTEEPKKDETKPTDQNQDFKNIATEFNKLCGGFLKPTIGLLAEYLLEKKPESLKDILNIWNAPIDENGNGGNTEPKEETPAENQDQQQQQQDSGNQEPATDEEKKTPMNESKGDVGVLEDPKAPGKFAVVRYISDAVSTPTQKNYIVLASGFTDKALAEKKAAEESVKVKPVL